MANFGVRRAASGGGQRSDERRAISFQGEEAEASESAEKAFQRRLSS
jgi:hypothetical protein